MKEEERIAENAKVLFEESILAIVTLQNKKDRTRRYVYTVNPELSYDDNEGAYLMVYYMLTKDSFRKNNSLFNTIEDDLEREMSKIELDYEDLMDRYNK